MGEALWGWKERFGCSSHLTKPWNRLAGWIANDRAHAGNGSLSLDVPTLWKCRSHSSHVTSSSLVALCLLDSWELGWRIRFFQRNAFFGDVECKRLEQLKTGPLQSLSYLWSQIKMCDALGVSWPSWGQDGEDFTSPATSCYRLLACPCCRCREEGAEGSHIAGQAEFWQCANQHAQ